MTIYESFRSELGIDFSLVKLCIFKKMFFNHFEAINNCQGERLRLVDEYMQQQLK